MDAFLQRWRDNPPPPSRKRGPPPKRQLTLRACPKVHPVIALLARSRRTRSCPAVPAYSTALIPRVLLSMSPVSQVIRLKSSSVNPRLQDILEIRDRLQDACECSPGQALPRTQSNTTCQHIIVSLLRQARTATRRSSYFSFARWTAMSCQWILFFPARSELS